MANTIKPFTRIPVFRAAVPGYAPGTGSRGKKEYEDVMRMKTELRRNTSRGRFIWAISGHWPPCRRYSKYRQGFLWHLYYLRGGGMDKEVWWKFTKEYNARDVIKIHLKSTDVSVDYYAIRELIAQTANDEDTAGWSDGRQPREMRICILWIS